MGAHDEACALNDRATFYARFTQKLQRNTATHDIDNGIDCTHLMKVHLIRRHTVDLAFGIGHALEDGHRLLLHPIAERTVMDHF